MNTTLALLFVSVSQSLSLPPGLLSAICFVESHHNAKAVNLHDGGSASHGACQVKIDTAKMLGYAGTAPQLQQPETNVAWAGRYLHYQLDRYDGDVVRAVAAYNAGTYTANPEGKPRNLKYVNKVINAWSEGR